jgi:hypothetical protein
MVKINRVKIHIHISLVCVSQPAQSFLQLNKNMYFDPGVEYRRKLVDSVN